MHSTFTLGCELCASTRDERLACMAITVLLLSMAFIGIVRLNGVK